ncbi:MAG: tRNA 2-selenouridine(34) synthase MnmH [Saprospiraceae bacterium]|nr:tRNA 2-selenouridine(34) synthase MnmH [Saprospiraceae bacterium]
MAGSYLVFDVRSPSEYNHAHIPNAINLPLFTDAERVIVGTAYKQKSREEAIKIGLDYFGPRMRSIVEEVESLISSHNDSGDKTILVHCWRGGMRSGAIAWLLDLYGFKVYLLIGGYKKFRNWVLTQFDIPYPFNVLGGYTGSGKTKLLTFLENQGFKIIDLEGLAKHKGSAFGNIGMPDQPSQEMFENLLATELFRKSADGGQGSIWLEDESQRIGHVNLPPALWRTMTNSRIFFLDLPFEARLNYLVLEYGNLPKSRMIDAITRIQKRLGHLEAQNTINFIQDNNPKEAFRILLKYYDKWYLKGLHRRENLDQLLIKVPCADVHESNNSNKILELNL